jgi:pyruvate formate lyase activating enzyme
VCGAKLQPVLDNIRLYKELGVWVEVTTLIIPGYSDDENQLKGIAGFIKSVDENIPGGHMGTYGVRHRKLSYLLSSFGIC